MYKITGPLSGFTIKFISYMNKKNEYKEKFAMPLKNLEKEAKKTPKLSSWIGLDIKV